MVRQHMATLKNCHSPAGMHFSTANLRHVNLLDCPGCKFGTLDYTSDKTMQCADCKREYTVEELHTLGVLSNGELNDRRKQSEL